MVSVPAARVSVGREAVIGTAGHCLREWALSLNVAVRCGRRENKEENICLGGPCF